MGSNRLFGSKKTFEDGTRTFALHVRRSYGSGVVILDFNRNGEMSPLLMRRRLDQSSPHDGLHERLGAQSSWGFPCREWTPSLTSHDVEKVSRLAAAETNPVPSRSK